MIPASLRWIGVREYTRSEVAELRISYEHICAMLRPWRAENSPPHRGAAPDGTPAIQPPRRPLPMTPNASEVLL